MKPHILPILLLIAVLATGTPVFAGGGAEEAEDGPLTVRMLYPDNSSYPLQEDWIVFEEIERATGVNLELIVAPDNTADFEVKRQIVFASGDIPEIVYTKFPAAAEDIQNGLLLPINRYLDRMPNLRSFLEEYEYDAEIENLTAADGNFYTLPVKADTVRMRIHSWMIRLDLFERHGIPVPATLDDVYEAGLELKRLYPDSRPIINRFGPGNILSLLGGGFGTAAGWSLNNDGHTYDEGLDRFVFAPATAEYRELLRWVHMLYEDGVLDQEFATMASSTYEQVAAQGDTFIFLDWVGNQVRYNLIGRRSDPDFRIWPIIPPAGPEGYAAERAPLYEQTWVLPATLPDHPRFDEVLRFIDWFYSEEASVITTFGVEGVTYRDDNGRLTYLDPDLDYTREHGLLNNALNVRRHPDWFVAMNGSEIGALFEEISERGIILPPEPTVRFTEDEVEDLKLLVPGVSDHYNRMTLQFIYGEANLDEDWDAYVEELRAKGSDEIGEIINGAWARQN